MQFSYFLTAFIATVVVAAPSPEEAQALEPKGCLPSSCDDSGVSVISSQAEVELQ